MKKEKYMKKKGLMRFLNLFLLSTYLLNFQHTTDRSKPTFTLIYVIRLHIEHTRTFIYTHILFNIITCRSKQLMFEQQQQQICEQVTKTYIMDEQVGS